MIYLLTILFSCSLMNPHFNKRLVKEWDKDIYLTAPVQGPFIAHHKKGPYEIIFFASHHTKDLKAPVIELLKDFYQKYSFDLMILEHLSDTAKPDIPSIVDVARKGISGKTISGGEGAMARIMAFDRKIPFIGAEPDGPEIYKKVKAAGVSDVELLGTILSQVVAWTWKLEERKIKLDSEFFTIMKDTCKHMGITSPICGNIGELKKWYKEVSGKDIEKITLDDIIPSKGSTMRAHVVSSLMGKIRDENFLKVLEVQLKKHKKIGVVSLSDSPAKPD